MVDQAANRPARLETAEEIRLISGAKHGDAAAFEILVDRFMGRAIGVAVGYVRNRDDAVDLAQEAFYRVYATLDRFRDGEPFAPWFFRILRNACLNFLAKRRRARHVSISAREDGESDWELADHGNPTPDHRAELNESQRQFWAALEKLPVKHREIIVLRHIEDLEYAAIAEILDIPIGTVMSRLFHARRKLRGHLEVYVEGSA